MKQQIRLQRWLEGKKGMMIVTEEEKRQVIGEELVSMDQNKAAPEGDVGA